jgi:hypothetical protein
MPQNKGVEFEERLKAFLPVLIKELGFSNINIRRQDAGTQNGFDLWVRYVDDELKNRQIFFECKNYDSRLSWVSLYKKFIEFEHSSYERNPFIVLSPNQSISNSKDQILADRYGHFSFPIEIWGPDSHIRAMFSLDPSLYQFLYKEDCPVEINRKTIINDTKKIFKSLFNAEVTPKQNNGIIERVYEAGKPVAKHPSHTNISTLKFPDISMQEIRVTSGTVSINPVTSNLVTLAILKRTSFKILLGHTQEEIFNLEKHLNIGEIVHQSTASEMQVATAERVWLTFNERNESREDLDKKIGQAITSQVGIIIILDTDVFLSRPVTTLLSYIERSNLNTDFSFIIEFISPNPAQLGDPGIINSLGSDFKVFLSTRIPCFAGDLLLESRSFSSATLTRSSIRSIYQKVAINPSTLEVIRQVFNDVVETKGTLQQEKISISQLIREFKQLLSTSTPVQTSVEKLFTDVANMIINHRFQLSEAFCGFAAQCDNNFIRYATLAQIIESQNQRLMDCWVEGTKADSKMFVGISEYVVPTPDLLLALLRYKYRHANEFQVQKNVHDLILNHLNGQDLLDKSLQELCLKEIPGDQILIKINYDNDTGEILKLLKAGLNVFNISSSQGVIDFFRNSTLDPGLKYQLLVSRQFSKDILDYSRQEFPAIFST